MKAISRRTAVLLSFLVLMLASGCNPKRKIQGEDGDQGETGDKGPAGVAGPAGPPGPTGTPGSANAWSLSGNSGTSSPTNFLGTLDSAAFEIHVNAGRIARFEPEGPGSSGLVGPNVLIGGPANSVLPGVIGATVLGGSALFPSTAKDDFCTVGGGSGNQAGDGAGTTADALGATVSGGEGNFAIALDAVVGGGASNTAEGKYSAICGGNGNYAQGDHSGVSSGEANGATAGWAFVGGGHSNWASGSRSAILGGESNVASADRSFVGGGNGNSATFIFATVVGGNVNTASGNADFVGGGDSNAASGGRAVVCGGYSNAASGLSCFVGGGLTNTAEAYGAATVGGDSNQAKGSLSAIVGGSDNTASGGNSIIGGGSANSATSTLAAILGGSGNVASGEGSTIPGGIENETRGLCALAAGRRALNLFDGSFVWADVASAAGVEGDPFRTDVRANQFNAFASGGVRFVTRYDFEGMPVASAELAPGGSSWLSLLDKDSVASLRVADPRDILFRLRRMPISSYSFAAQDSSVRHLGPLAADFKAAFGLGESDRHIGHLDADGVALAAIQGLALELDARDARIASLETEAIAREARTMQALSEKQGRIDELEARLARVERLLEAAGIK